MKAVNEIKFPSEITYFIAYTNTDIFGYGIVNPEQEMQTGQPILYQTTTMTDWIKELQDVFGVKYPDLPTDFIWGYSFSTKAEAEESAAKVPEYTVEITENDFADYWYFEFQLGMEEVLGEPVIVEK